MKFCDKLVKQRKNNNMSQEQLADRLGVSRQAVSKWESGTSMPDMEKIMQLCKILNCSLDDLVDDAACGNAKISEQKVGIHTYLQEVLDFITKTLNMFWSMRFVEKVKCILEMVFVILLMVFIWGILGSILRSIFDGIIYMLPNVLYRVIYHLSSVLYSIFGLIVGAIIFIHIFKIRYLDYFVTIEDSETNNKTIEEPVDEEVEEKERKFIEKKKNKIIIRDPKHSTYSFFTVLAHMVVWFLKFVLIFVAIPCILSFIFFVFSMTMSFWLLKDGIFFLGTTIILVGCIFVNYVILRVIYNFIFDQKQNLKRIFFIFIIGISLAGVGFGASFCTYLTFDKTDLVSEFDYDTKEITINSDIDNVVLSFLNYGNVEIVEDDSVSGIKINFTYNSDGDIHFYSYKDSGYTYDESLEYLVYDYNYYNDSNKWNGFDVINSLLDLLKDKKRIDNYEQASVSRVKVTISKDNLEKIKENYENFYY